MQTFVPYADFAATAAALDDRRLGKQRVEGIQIVRALTWPEYAWKSHPAVLMWHDHEAALEAYLAAVCDEWARRGYADTCRATIRQDLARAGIDPPRPQDELAGDGLLPAWLGDEVLHRNHRGALLRKDPEHYGRIFDPTDAEGWDGYLWPVRSPKVLAAEAARAERAARRARAAEEDATTGRVPASGVPASGVPGAMRGGHPRPSTSRRGAAAVGRSRRRV